MDDTDGTGSFFIKLGGKFLDFLVAVHHPVKALISLPFMLTIIFLVMLGYMLEREMDITW